MYQVKIAATMWSFRREIGIIFGVLAALIILPMIVILGLFTDGAQGITNNPGATLYTGAASTQNTYDYGYCTFWADKRREDIGKPIPNNWGNANTWAERAQAAGYTVDHTPAVNAIMQTTAGDLGHVAFVESVTPDGGWTVSEMNAPTWDVVSGRTFRASIAATYNFIH
jgi:surface antigen